MSWKAGDLVDVYDPDDEVWLPGRIDAISWVKGFRFTIVATDSALYDGLPLKIAVPFNRQAWIRERTPTRTT